MFAYVVSKRAKRNLTARDVCLRGEFLLNYKVEEQSFNPLWSGRSAQDSVDHQEKKNVQKAVGGRGDIHYGMVDDDLIYFRKMIATSHHVLDAHISNSNPQHRHKSYQFVRDYLKIIKRDHPQLLDSLCEEYVELYEEARFGNAFDNFSERDAWAKKFQKCEDVLFRIIASCNDDHDDKDSHKDFGRLAFRQRKKHGKTVKVNGRQDLITVDGTLGTEI